MKTIFILLLFSFCLSSCFSNKQLQIGCYEYKNENLIFYSLLQLKSDSTYYFTNDGDMYHDKQVGRWTVKGNKLLLTGYNQPITNSDGKKIQRNKKFKIKDTTSFALKHFTYHKITCY